MARPAPPGSPSAPPTADRNWSIFVSVMTEIVVPGLDGAGLGANAAWRAIQARRAVAA